MDAEMLSSVDPGDFGAPAGRVAALRLVYLTSTDSLFTTMVGTSSSSVSQ